MAKKILKFRESLATVQVGENPNQPPYQRTSTKEDIYIYPKIEAIHAGPTKNNTFYQKEKLKGDSMIESGVYSWTHPYDKPMLTHHNQGSGEPIGRVVEARYAQQTSSDREGIIVVAKITDPEAIEKVLDGRYQTVSIGGETDGATCSICGQELTEGMCDHIRGEEYEGRKCYWILNNIWFKELSFVNVPADTDAKVVDVGVPMESKESEQSILEDFIRIQDKDSKSESGEYEIVSKSSVPELEDNMDISKFYSMIQKLRNNNLSEYQISQYFKKASTNVLEENQGGEKMKDLPRLEDMTEEQIQEFLEKTPEDLETAKLQIEAFRSKVKNLESEVEKKAELETTNSTLSEKVETLQSEKEELEQSKTTIEQEKDELQESNVELRSRLHQGLAQRVVDMKLALNKPGIEDRETAVQEHSERSSESLLDTLEDLQSELDNNETANAMAATKLKNKGKATSDQDKDPIEEPTEDDDDNDDDKNTDDKGITLEHVYKDLFSGGIRRRKNKLSKEEK